VTVIDRQAHHLFQPLLYQVATGVLSQGNIAPPLRDVLRHQRNAEVVLAEVDGVDLERRTVRCRLLDCAWEFAYDSLIVAAGSAQSCFGHDEFALHAPGMNTIDDALEVRGRIFGAFELAEPEEDASPRLAFMTFVVIGAGVELKTSDGVERLPALTKIWSAGVQASPLGRLLAAQARVEPTRSGQAPVEPDCTLPGHPEVFVAGDLMALDGLPGLAEVAIQSGRHAAAEIRRRLDGDRQPHPFRYRDLGSLATVSRYYAIGERRGARVWGFAGWLIWLVVHLTFLTGFKNRVSALFHWMISFFGRSRPERTITAQQVFARQALRGNGLGG